MPGTSRVIYLPKGEVCIRGPSVLNNRPKNYFLISHHCGLVDDVTHIPASVALRNHFVSHSEPVSGHEERKEKRLRAFTYAARRGSPDTTASTAKIIIPPVTFTEIRIEPTNGEQLNTCSKERV